MLSAGCPDQLPAWSSCLLFSLPSTNHPVADRLTIPVSSRSDNWHELSQRLPPASHLSHQRPAWRLEVSWVQVGGWWSTENGTVLWRECILHSSDQGREAGCGVRNKFPCRQQCLECSWTEEGGKGGCVRTEDEAGVDRCGSDADTSQVLQFHFCCCEKSQHREESVYLPSIPSCSLLLQGTQAASHIPPTAEDK